MCCCCPTFVTLVSICISPIWTYYMQHLENYTFTSSQNLLWGQMLFCIDLVPIERTLGSDLPSPDFLHLESLAEMGVYNCTSRPALRHLHQGCQCRRGCRCRRRRCLLHRLPLLHQSWAAGVEEAVLEEVFLFLFYTGRG